MSGEIRLDAPADSVIARSVRLLARFPTDEPWVLIVGIAVFTRLGSVTRPTAEADTVARSQARLLDRLLAEDQTILVANRDVTIPVDGVAVEVDLMDLADEPLPLDPERRAFALARSLALNTATTEAATVTDRTGTIVAEAILPIATIPALVALKTVSMVRRPTSSTATPLLRRYRHRRSDRTARTRCVGARTCCGQSPSEQPGQRPAG